jgi:hypothetical protein
VVDAQELGIQLSPAEIDSIHDPRFAVLDADSYPRSPALSLSRNAFLNFATFGATTYAQYGWLPLREK